MSMDAISSVSGNPEFSKDTKVNVKHQEKTLKHIDTESSKSQQISEEEYKKAVKRLRKLLEHKSIDITMEDDEESGMRQLIFSDPESGKVIKKMPEDAVIEIANKAVQEMDSWLLDIFI